jgi:hypothetical protein
MTGDLPDPLFKQNQSRSSAPGDRLPTVLVRNTVLPMPTMSFKVSEDEARLIRALARKEKLTLSEYLRRRASSGSGATPAPVQRTRCKHTGATIFAANLDLPPLSTESVRAMLADFP